MSFDTIVKTIGRDEKPLKEHADEADTPQRSDFIHTKKLFRDRWEKFTRKQLTLTENSSFPYEKTSDYSKH